MPLLTIFPVAVTGWRGAAADIDEGVATHDSDGTYIDDKGPDCTSLPGTNTSLNGTVSFPAPNNPVGTKIRYLTVKVAYRTTKNTTSANGLAMSLFWTDSVAANNAGPSAFCLSKSYQAKSGPVGTVQPNGVGSDTVSGISVQIQGEIGTPGSCAEENRGCQIRITAMEIEVFYESPGGGDGGGGGGSGIGPISATDQLTFTESLAVVSGTGSTSSISATESLTFSETASFVSSQGNIATGRTDIACRACGTFVPVREDLILYADGHAQPVTWDGVSATTTSLAQPKKLQFPVSSRNRVFLYGDEPYDTGTVTTVAGSTQLILNTGNWPAGVLGKPIAIEGVNFVRSDGTLNCQAVITVINNTLATVSDAPDTSFAAANFIVFGATAGAELQWSADGDHVTWTDPVIPVNQFDGDLPTGAFALADWVIVCKRRWTGRFDWAIDPRLPPNGDGLLSTIAEERGLVSNKSVVVLEGTAYLMDQQPNYFWFTRGGALFPFDIGLPIKNALEAGGEYEIDWTKSACWFAWHSPKPNSVCFAATLKGESYPRVVFEYMRPNIDGLLGPDAQAAYWVVRIYHHYIRGAVNAVDSAGVIRAFIACADRDSPTSIWVTEDDNEFGDMATGFASGTVVSQTDSKTLVVGKHTALHKGSLIEIDRSQTRTISTDNGNTITVSADITGNVALKKWRAGFRPKARFRTVYIEPQPNWARARMEAAYCHWEKSNADAELKLIVRSDANADWAKELGASADSTGTFQATERVTGLAPGVSGYAIDVELDLVSPDGKDPVRSLEMLVRKFRTPPLGDPAE